VRTRIREDIATACRSDPAARSPLEVVLTYPGIHALWMHHLAHDLWTNESRLVARLISHGSRFATGVEIHPGATIGRNVFIDHGMGVVIGETAKVGDGCLIYKGVVLGGTSLEHKVRHPQVGNDVVIGSNACVLGNITIGDGARIGSGSVVVKPVPPHGTVVGVPARLVLTGDDRHARFSQMLDHSNLPDPVSEMIRLLMTQNEKLKNRVEQLEEKLEVKPPESEHFDDKLLAVQEALPKLEGG
jgi:serine O-acetyltransferase